MEGWIVGLIMGAVELVITTILGLFIKTWWNKKQKEKEELEKLREENRLNQEQTRYDDVKNTVRTEVLDLENKVKEEFKKTREETKNDLQKVKKEVDTVKQDLCSMKRTMQKDTRRSLRQDAIMYINRGWATGQEKTEFDELYWCYHNLGKNGVVDSDHKKVMELPEAAPKGE